MNESITALTLGNYKTEIETAAGFDAAFERHLSKQFRCYWECPGQVVHKPHGTIVKGVIIDRILMPTNGLIDSGFAPQPIGVELKKSGVKSGRPLAQCMDNRRCAFDLREADGRVRVTGFMLDAVFLFPFKPPGGCLNSIIAQNRVGGMAIDYDGHLALYLGEQVMASFYEGKITRENLKTCNSYGRRIGNRG